MAGHQALLLRFGSRESATPTRWPLFLNISDNLGFAQCLGQALILVAECLGLFPKRIASNFGARWCGVSPSNAGLSLAPPRGQQRRVQPFAPKQRSAAARAFGLVGFTKMRSLHSPVKRRRLA